MKGDTSIDHTCNVNALKSFWVPPLNFCIILSCCESNKTVGIALPAPRDHTLNILFLNFTAVKAANLGFLVYLLYLCVCVYACVHTHT